MQVKYMQFLVRNKDCYFVSLCSGEEIEKTVAINVMIYAVKIETKLVKLKCEAGHFIIPKS